MDPMTVLEQLNTLAKRYTGTQTATLAYVTSRWIESALNDGDVQSILRDPIIQDVLLEARLATDCGWSPSFAARAAGESNLTPP